MEEDLVLNFYMPTKKAATVSTVAKVPVRAVKKSPAKKSVRTLTYASDVQSFWTHSGEVLNSLAALRDAFTKMSKDTFSHHVGTGKNDFATWVEVVLKDAACATDLRKAKTATSARTVVVRHLKEYGQ